MSEVVEDGADSFDGHRFRAGSEQRRVHEDCRSCHAVDGIDGAEHNAVGMDVGADGEQHDGELPHFVFEA